MKKLLVWICFIALIIIHTLDMELTRVFIGNDWQNETFPPMSYCIKQFGISNAIWISRSIIYPFFLLILFNHESSKLQKILIVVTILYWVSMIQWLDTFSLFPFNFVCENGF